MMLACQAILSLNDAMMKWLTDGYSVAQLLGLRATMALPVTIVIALMLGGRGSLVVHSWRAQAVRAILMVGGQVFFVAGLAFLPLADAVAIGFATPLFITALAPLLLSEAVGWRRWAAVAVGFAGVVIIVGPTGGGMQLAALLPLIGALVSALRDLVTRRISRYESSHAILVVTTGATAVLCMAVAVFDWRAMAGFDLALLAVAAVMASIAHLLMIEAFRLAEAALVAPFKYSTMIWSVLLGWLIWGAVPGTQVWIGAALVVASGLYILHRERVRRRAFMPPPGAGG
ncbi:MAG: DMT family transporter [Thalassobaculales bacterium]